jgi:hypothetical protein
MAKTYVLLDRGGGGGTVYGGMGSPSQNSSLNYLELIYVAAVCLMSRGFFFDWGTPFSFAQPTFHVVNAAFFLMLANPRSDILAFTTLMDLLAFAAQYSVQFGVLDMNQYHFDDYHKEDGDAKNWTKLGLVILPLVLDVLRTFYFCLRPTYGADKRSSNSSDDESDDVEEVTTTVQPQQMAAYHRPMTTQRYAYMPVSQLGL